MANEARQNTAHQDNMAAMIISHPSVMKSVPTLSVLKQSYPGLRTLLFDMDGTLFDTEKYHTLALQRIGQEQKIIPPVGPKELHQMMMGKADHLLFEIIKNWPGFPENWDVKRFIQEKNKHLLDLLKSVAGESFFSGQLKNLLIEARTEKFQIGLVTSSEKVITLELLSLAGLSEFFSFVLTRDDTLKVKPDPWPYNKAIEHFQAEAKSTLIFEDSNVGLESAIASGAQVIKVEWY